MKEAGNRNFFFMVLPLISCFLASACNPTYPKENLENSVQKLFQKELGVNVRSKLAGKTLYISFEVKSMVTNNLDFSDNTVDKLEKAMLSVARIALSTDADINFTVIEARDVSFGVKTVLIRGMQDLKGLFYWRISKPDFDKRLIWETMKRDEFHPDWHDITFPEFMGRLVASRMNWSARTNPFFAALAGVRNFNAVYDAGQKSLRLISDHYLNYSSTDTSSVSIELLKGSVTDQMNQIEKDYLYNNNQQTVSKDWVNKVVVENFSGIPVFEIQKEEWRKSREK